MKTPTETWYVWKEYCPVEKRLLTPWADPMVHEYPFDYFFRSPEEAKEGKNEYGAKDEDWVLCKLIIEPIESHQQ